MSEHTPKVLVWSFSQELSSTYHDMEEPTNAYVKSVYEAMTCEKALETRFGVHVSVLDAIGRLV